MAHEDQRAYYAYVWQANQQLGEELRRHAQAGEERIKALRAELAQLEREVSIAQAAAGALLHRGALPRSVVEAARSPRKTEQARLRVLSQTHPPAAELEGREIAHAS